MAKRLAGKIAIVTGAGRGNGRAIALGFADQGANVVVAEVDPVTGPQVVEEIRSRGVESLPIQVDVTSAASVNAMVEQVMQRFGRIDILVNNAGVQSYQSALEVTESEFDRLMAVNLKGPFLCSQAVARRMREQGGGSIINITSSSAVLTPPNLTSYASSKGGLVGQTQAMSADLARFNIRLNGICPAVIRTDLNKHRLDQPGVTERESSRMPLGRIGRPEDLVGAAVFLASEESAWITGTNLRVDGGFLSFG